MVLPSVNHYNNYSKSHNGDSKSNIKQESRQNSQDQRLKKALTQFQLSSYSLIKQCMLDAGFNGANVAEFDPLYVEFATYAISSEMKRIDYLMEVTTKQKSVAPVKEHNYTIQPDNKNYDMLLKATKIFQVKVCSMFKQSMTQAQYPINMTYECNPNYISFAKMALDKELSRISRFADANSDNSSSYDNNINNYTHFHENDQDCCINSNNSFKKSVSSESTEITGSLSGRKRFFESLIATEQQPLNSHEPDTSNHNITKNQSYGILRDYRDNDGIPVILNPYYYRRDNSINTTVQETTATNRFTKIYK